MRRGEFFIGKFLTVLFVVGILWPVIFNMPVYASGGPAVVEPVSPGVQLETYLLSGTKVYVLRVDLTNPYVLLDTMVGSDGTFRRAQNVTEMAQKAGAVAGINGGFFQMKNHRPIGLVFHDGEMVASPAQRQDMPGFGITKDNKVLMNIFGFSGQVYAENGNTFPLFGVNKPDYLLPTGKSADLNSLNMYTPLWGDQSRMDIAGSSEVVEVVIQAGQVTAVNAGKPGTAIPADGYVLEGQGAAAKFLLANLPVGSKVNVDYMVTPEWTNLRGAVGGNTLLVENGQVSSFTQEISGKVARTAVGILPDNKTLCFVAAEKSAVSAGLTQREVADFLVSLGAARAVNLDGGGSTTLAARHPGDSEASLINKPQAGAQRALPDAIGIFSTAPKGDLAGLVVNGPDVILAGISSGLYTVKGYDQYYNPFQVNPQEIVWTADPGGQFTAGSFKPSVGGPARIAATVNGIRGEKTIRVIGAEDLAELNIDPAVISVEPGSTVSPKISVKTKSGEVFNLNTGDFQISVNGQVGTLEGTTFTAGQNPGTGELSISFQGLTKVIPVTVRNPGSAVQLLPGNSTQLDLDENTKLDFPPEAVTAPLDLKVKPVYDVEIPGYKTLAVFDVLNPQGVAAALNVPWCLQYHYTYESAGAANSAVMVVYKETGSSSWIPQPALAEKVGPDNGSNLYARVKGLGQVAIVRNTGAVPTFSDISTHWCKQTVETMAAQGVVTGYPNGTFRPEQAVTRAEFVSLLYRAMLWTKEADKPTFKDNIPAWAADAIAAAFNRGVVSGYPDGTFMPGKGISRAEMAVIIDRVLKLPAAPDQNVPVFYDEDTLPPWAVDQINRVASVGILNGDNGMFRPEDNASRAEVAAAISRVLTYWIKH